ncbi:hypothetical protein CR513_01869 [Mucuna pruriens]|uniref:Uncharacterized protein n=1 Tax=Mucuna pruriens TaxID=157652 RepID=A0A371IDY9_MUCPR|nr:hypothetical protein CR513_01869 [Mucuna pruriens]
MIVETLRIGSTRVCWLAKRERKVRRKYGRSKC